MYSPCFVGNHKISHMTKNGCLFRYLLCPYRESTYTIYQIKQCSYSCFSRQTYVETLESVYFVHYKQHDVMEQQSDMKCQYKNSKHYFFIAIFIAILNDTQLQFTCKQNKMKRKSESILLFSLCGRIKLTPILP